MAQADVENVIIHKRGQNKADQLFQFLFKEKKPFLLSVAVLVNLTKSCLLRKKCTAMGAPNFSAADKVVQKASLFLETK